MTTSARSRETDAAILAAIIDGKPWTNGSIRNLQLQKHCRTLGKTFRAKPDSRYPGMRIASRELFTSVASRSRLLESPNALSRDIVPALIRVAIYSEQWIRSPSSWSSSPSASAGDQWSDLLRHLFTRWPMPRFFDSAWLQPGCPIYLERDWFCHIARGGSWRVAPHLPPSISAAALHRAMHAPDQLSIRQALRWGQLMALDASPQLMEEVLAGPMVRDLSNDAIWSRLMAKVCGARDFRPRHFGIIADLLLDLLRHDQERRVVSLLDEPLPSLLRHCFRCWKELLKCAFTDGARFRDADLRRQSLRTELLHLSRAAWAPMSNVSSCEEKYREHESGGSRWQIRERLTQAQLLSESRQLKHCVSGYVRRCRTGRSAIFSLLQIPGAEGVAKPVPRLTIEVEPRFRRVVQIRGKFNRWPDDFEYGLITEWAAANSLQMAV